MEHLDFAFETKALTEDGTFEGYASVFGSVDLGGDRVEPGAFAKTIRKRGSAGIRMLWQHDPSQPIGVWDEFQEDQKGLFAKGRFVPGVAKAAEVHALLKARAIGGMSIGFTTVKSEPDGNQRLLKEVDLWEVSLVTFPMEPKARVTAVKAVPEDLVTKLAAGDRLTEREFEQMVKGLGLSNSQAERAARIHLKGQGEPAVAASDGLAFLRALRG